MRHAFWVRRIFSLFAIVFVLLAGLRMLKGNTLEDAAAYALLWAAISSAVFAASRFYQARQGRRCEICQDAPAIGSGSAVTRPEAR